MPQLQRLTILLTTAFMCVCLHANTKTPHSIDTVTKKIAHTQQTLRSSQRQQSQLQHTLEKNELKIGALSKQHSTTQKTLKQQKTQLFTLQRKIQQSQTALSNNAKQFSHLISQAYLFAHASPLQLVLNTTNPEQTQRLLGYYRCLSEQQWEAIQHTHTILSTLNTQHSAQQQHVAALQQLAQKLNTESRHLKTAQKERNATLTTLHKTIGSQRAQLKHLQASKQRLEQTLYTLRTHTIGSGRFIKQPGRLQWPTAGRVVQLFNAPIDHSPIKSNGILISAPLNQPVRAIADGQVIFAKWLPTYGLMLIISHQDGYMTLYGRNHYLYKKVGDHVKQGDLIATVGQSGGHAQPALYFAMRHNATPINPLTWLTKTNTNTQKG